MDAAALTITVPQPCAADWEQMTPTEQGRHCRACDQVVVDFTAKSDAELLLWLARPAPVCGHFRADQLNRALQVPALPPPAPRWQSWLSAAAADAARYGRFPTP